MTSYTDFYFLYESLEMKIHYHNCLVLSIDYKILSDCRYSNTRQILFDIIDESAQKSIYLQLSFSSIPSVCKCHCRQLSVINVFFLRLSIFLVINKIYVHLPIELEYSYIPLYSVVLNCRISEYFPVPLIPSR